MSNQDRAEGVRGILEDLLDYVDIQTCTHEETHRGGAIWTICDQCGKKWADDTGGFQPHTDAPAVAAARAYLDTPQAPGADTPGGRGEGEVACWRPHWPDGSHGPWRDGDIKPTHRAECEKDGLTIELAYTHPAESSGGDAVDAARWRTLRDYMPKEYNHDKGFIRWYLPRARGGFMGLQEHIDSLRGYAAIASGAEHGR